MKIVIFYLKTQKTVEQSVLKAELGPGGIFWENEETFGFIGFSSGWKIRIEKD